MKKSLPVLLLSALLLSTQTHAAENERTLTVRGSATQEAVPDMAVITLAVETLELTARESAASNAKISEGVARALKRAIGPADEVNTASYSVFPVYEFDKGRREVLKGFRTAHHLRVTTERTSATGEILDKALEAGANRVVDVRFDMKDTSGACAGLIRSAAAKAASQANAAASAFGTGLDGVKTIMPFCNRESEGPVRPFGAEVMKMSADQAFIEPGTVRLRAEVEAVYILGGQR